MRCDFCARDVFNFLLFCSLLPASLVLSLSRFSIAHLFYKVSRISPAAITIIPPTHPCLSYHPLTHSTTKIHTNTIIHACRTIFLIFNQTRHTYESHLLHVLFHFYLSSHLNQFTQFLSLYLNLSTHKFDTLFTAFNSGKEVHTGFTINP